MIDKKLVEAVLEVLDDEKKYTQEQAELLFAGCKTDYYEELLYHMIGGKKKQVTQDKMFIRTSNSPIYKTIRCLRLYGLSQTIRECKNAIKRCLHGKKSGNRGQGRLY